GEVEVRPTEKQSIGNNAPQRLSGGQGLRVGNSFSQTEIIPANARRFSHAIPIPESELDDYARLVLADKPVAYWWLRDPLETRMAADLTGNHRGVYAGFSRAQHTDVVSSHVKSSL